MPAPNISFAKIVATPTPKAWSQAYNAGSLFLALSLTCLDEEVPLVEEGKKMLSTVEAEFFGLEEKTLESIQHILTQSLATLSDTVTASLAFSYIKDDILYCFVKGEGVVTLKRETHRAPLLKGTQDDALLSASGHLKTDDLILLETEQFATLIPEATLKEAFEYPIPNDIAETISPHVHNSQEGGASAIILAFKGIPKPFPVEEAPQTEEDEHHMPADHDAPIINKRPPLITAPSHSDKGEPAYAVPDGEHTPSLLLRMRDKIPSLPFHLTKQKQLILGIALLLLLLLIGSIVFTKQNQVTAEQEKLFAEIYPAALKEYEEGESLVNLNEALAREDYVAAQEILARAEGKFSPESEYGQKITALKEKVEARLGTTGKAKTLTATEVEPDEAPLLALLQETPKALASTENNDTLSVLTPNDIVSVDKTTGGTETVVENDSTWTQAVSIATFGTNFYILDQEEGLLKLVPTDDGYVSSSYFASNEPDLSRAVSLAIDGSIYLLSKDGTVAKYTSGEQEAFKITGLEKPLEEPTQLVTSPDMDNLYLLDPGTNRIIKVGKDGVVKEIYQADILTATRAITVSADETSLSALSGDTIYRLDLN